MGRKSKRRKGSSIGRQARPDSTREVDDRQKGLPHKDHLRDERERSDQGAGAGRPVQLDEIPGTPPTDWPEPGKDAPPQK